MQLAPFERPAQIRAGRGWGGGMATLVFDIGGTRTRAGLFDRHQTTILRSVSASTPNHLDHPESPFERLRDELLSLMRRLGNELAARRQISEVDVAFAGPID